MGIDFSGERIVPGAANCEPAFAQKMYQEHVARYAFAAQLVQDKEVLDVACGVGYGSQLLAKSGAKSVLGIDIAEDAIQHAAKNYFHPSVSFRVQDAREIEFAGQFDVVTCFEFIEHVDEQPRVLDAIKQALRPGGILIISTPRPLEEMRSDFHVHELNYEDLRRMLSERFSKVDSFFERNCFTSFVGAKAPSNLDRIMPITDRLQLEHADYFVFVAQDGGGNEANSLQPVLTVNDDSYVLRLEQDMVNFRNGENYHKGLINDLSERCGNLTVELNTARSELEEQRKRAESLDLVLSELAKITADVSAIREAVIEDEVVRRRSAELESVMDGLRHARDEAVQQSQNLMAENSRIRTVLSKVAQKLAETETRLNAKLAEADLVAHERSIAHGLRSELAAAREEQAALRLRFEECERTLNRFRGSVSWAVTRPIRWVGRQYKKLAGRSAA